MIDQKVNFATRIFLYAFPNYQAIFAFDNMVNYACFTENAFLTKKINLDMAGKKY